MKYESVCHWEIGGRTKNQDSLSLQQLSVGKKPILFVAVCDGIGGLQQGEFASAYVTRQMTDWFYKRATKVKIGKKLYAESCRMLNRLHKELMEYGNANSIKLGTTMSAVLVQGNRYMILHIGDSRIYEWKRCIFGCKMCCITTDHVIKKGVLSRCIGEGEYWKPEMKRGFLRKGEAMLICSDGFYDNISREQMEQYLLPWNAQISEEEQLENRLQKRLEEVAKRGKERGTKDNISAVYLQRVK